MPRRPRRNHSPKKTNCISKQAALRIGGVQIQNRATVVGNICNASPAADGVPGLLCLDAQVELSSRSAKRNLPLGEFIKGNRNTVIHADELVSALLIPKLPETALSGFEKLGTRSYLVISIVMVAAVLNRNVSFSALILPRGPGYNLWGFCAWSPCCAAWVRSPRKSSFASPPVRPRASANSTVV